MTRQTTTDQAPPDPGPARATARSSRARTGARTLDAELRETREVLPGQRLQTYQVSGSVSGALPGQYVHVRTPDRSGDVLRRPFSIDSLDRVHARVSIHLRDGPGDGLRWLAALRPGERIAMTGPLGRGFELDPRARHLLLVASELGIASVRLLATDALAAGKRVTLLFGAHTAADVYPSSLLPDEIEYVVATEDGSLGHHGRVTDLVPAYEAWADQAFVAGPLPLLEATARLAAGRDARLGVARLGSKGRTRSAAAGSAAARRKAWLQVAFGQEMGCAAGVCLGCVVMTVDGPQRVCREGPVFAASEIAWGDAP